MGEDGKFKFGEYVDYSKSQHADGKPSVKERGQGYVTHFRFYTPEIFLERLKLEISDFVHWQTMWSISLEMADDLSIEWA